MRLLCRNVIIDFFRKSACDILQNDLYQTLFQSRHLNNMKVSDYLTISQMETSETWGTEIDVLLNCTGNSIGDTLPSSCKDPYSNNNTHRIQSKDTK